MFRSTACSPRCSGWREGSAPARSSSARGLVTTPSPPRLNHVAITLDPAVLDETGRKEILDFYGEVFGWTEGDNTGEKGNPLILYTGTFAQFVYLLPGDPFLTAPHLDHFGLQVATRDELAEHVKRAKAYK